MEHQPQRWEGNKPAPQESFTAIEPISSFQVQRALILMMDPSDRRHAAELWTTEDVAGDSYAKRFREYVEQPKNADRAVDLTDEAVMMRLFKEITNPTIH